MAYKYYVHNRFVSLLFYFFIFCTITLPKYILVASYVTKNYILKYLVKEAVFLPRIIKKVLIEVSHIKKNLFCNIFCFNIKIINIYLVEVPKNLGFSHIDDFYVFIML
ncbi:hypothetical protein EDEG_02842 [Edhazardia aedis USNM 41457]|uniref:Uncharacterized protein n=1 Tax=Edhazardia aedis (strain USNM 41457) TaxID=1003232 RepID=J9D5F4_EDHAE|nr:hypothetical protein EDEG_02842 [Edhazardia aedis USNM 41457]|eukprot:EJW02764.1 hypothetical protein EDEG_02842 [Edhazardia aedis USNM 41457]